MAEEKSGKKKTNKKKASGKKISKKKITPKKDALEKKEKACEIFEIEEKGKEKIIEKCGDFEEEHASKKNLEKQNKTLRNILIGLVLLVIGFIATILLVQSMSKFTYENTKFEITKEGRLLLYRTTLPVYYQGQIRDYNFYLRNDPRKLKNIEFDGEVHLLKNAVVNMSEIKCDGDEIIALANLIKLWNIIGTNVIKDENASCDELGRYIYLNIAIGDETKIIEKSPACYEMTIDNCKILEATEKFMVETFVELNKVNGRTFSLD
jgi:hypothetical protein